MSYTAFEKMRTVNYERFGKDLGPVQPPLLNNLLFLPGQSSGGIIHKSSLFPDQAHN